MSDDFTPSANPSTGAASADAQEQTTALTPELVAKVSDRVYALLLRDMKMERERCRYGIESNRGD